MPLELRSTAFKNNDWIPIDFTGEGRDISPALEWSNVPYGTREFALLCDDPDAPTEREFVHWLAYRISPETTFLPEGIEPKERLLVPVRLDQGRNSFNRIGYGGPLPPFGHGVHHYGLKLFALNEELGLPPGATRDDFEKAIEGHVLDAAQLIGRYERKAAENERRRTG